MRSMMRVVVGVMLLVSASVRADLPAGPGDWPGWRGAARDNVSKESGLQKSWPKEGPTLLWKAKGLGSGYSTPSIAKGVVFVIGTEKKDTEAVIALNAKDGSQIWSTPFGKTAGGYPGPRSTPTVDGQTLYAISSNGILIAAKTASGEILWQKDFKKEFGGRHGSWAFAESPLVDGDVLVCTPGGETASMVALNKKSGEVIWKSSLGEVSDLGKKAKSYGSAGYSSIIVANLQGVKQYVQFLHGGVIGVDAKTGQFLWRYDHPANGTANISTPIQVGDAIFAASGYGTGGGLAKIVKKDGKLEAEEAYFVKEMQNHHGGMVVVNGFLYGTGNGALLCVDLTNGKIAWQNKSVGKGAVTYADGHIYLRSERGPVGLVEANPKEYKETGRFDQPERSNASAWAHPVIAGGHLYLRDQDQLFCYDIKAK